MRRCWMQISTAAAALLWLPGLAGVQKELQGDVRTAVVKAIPLLEKGSAGYIRQRRCFSCHHQALPVLALGAARDRGLPVDLKNLAEQVKHTETDLRGNLAAYREGRGQGGGSTRAGYALWTLAARDWKPDETTAAVAGFLLQRDQSQGHWRTSSQRPPSEASSFTSTFLALRSLEVYTSPGDAERRTTRVAQARDWLLRTPARDTEDRVFRLWSLKLAGADEAEVRKAAQELLEGQREDGGWSQTAELKSDAYATGCALVALHQSGQLKTAEAAYRKGLSHLVGTQLPDGSWHVVSRSKPFQPYFESGFPHGKDQWISSAATSWAVWALCLP